MNEREQLAPSGHGLLVLHADHRTADGAQQTAAMTWKSAGTSWKADVVRSRDHLAYAMFWTCLPTVFSYHYKVDEHLYIIAGEAFIRESDNPDFKIRIGAGDYVFFPAGTTFTWEVTKTIRKVAVMHEQVPVVFGLALKLFNRVFRRNR